MSGSDGRYAVMPRGSLVHESDTSVEAFQSHIMGQNSRKGKLESTQWVFFLNQNHIHQMHHKQY